MSCDKKDKKVKKCKLDKKVKKCKLDKKAKKKKGSDSDNGRKTMEIRHNKKKKKKKDKVKYPKEKEKEKKKKSKPKSKSRTTRSKKKIYPKNKPKRRDVSSSSTSSSSTSSDTSVSSNSCHLSVGSWGPEANNVDDSLFWAESQSSFSDENPSKKLSQRRKRKRVREKILAERESWADVSYETDTSYSPTVKKYKVYKVKRYLS
jgi:hypothetical protein